LAIHNLYSASVKKATHKKVVAAANTIIPGIFENLENRIAKMQIKRDQSAVQKKNIPINWRSFPNTSSSLNSPPSSNTLEPLH
jgi:hypothetical protein